MTDSTQRELRMLANRMLTQTEARNGYQGSPVCLLLRKDAEKAMALMTKAADLVDVLESSLRLQAEVAADANAQANAMRRLLGEVQSLLDDQGSYIADLNAEVKSYRDQAPAAWIRGDKAITQDTLSDHDVADPSELMSHGWVPLYAAPVPAQPVSPYANWNTAQSYPGITANFGEKPILFPECEDGVYIAGLAAEAYRENEPDAGNDDDDLEAVAACLEDDAAIVREVDGYEEVPANMEKAASIIRRFAAQQNREKGQ